jgi:hypothetical protein
MGKRSSFPRKPRDLYATPFEAVAPLIPHLKGIRTFAEPCAGEGDLVRHLESYDLKCAYEGDISYGKDALARNIYDGNCDAIITNPPYTRALMHQLILHFAGISPTWLLIDADWVTSLQAVPYLKFCSDIVVIGRLRWIPNSPFTAKDSSCWYRFDSKHHGYTRIHNDRERR